VGVRREERGKVWPKRKRAAMLKESVDGGWRRPEGVSGGGGDE